MRSVPNPDYRTSTKPDLIVLLCLASVIGGKSMVATGVSLGDCLYALCAILTTPRLITQPVGKTVYWLMACAVALSLWSYVNYEISSSLRDLNPKTEFWASFAKLNLYAVGGIPIVNHIARINLAPLTSAIYFALMTSTWVAVIVFVLQNLGLYADFRAPVSFLWSGMGGEEAYFDGFLNLGGISVIKVRGFFMEASLYSIYTVMLLAILRVKPFEPVRGPALYLVIASVSLTFSLTGVALLLCYFAMTSSWRPRRFFRLNFRFAVCSAAVVILGFFVWDVYVEFVYERTLGILAGDDRSTSRRWNASLDTMVLALQLQPMLGSSLGFLDITPAMENIQFQYQTDINEWVVSSGNNQIVPFYFLGSLGPIGILLFIATIIPACRRFNVISTVFCLSLFAHGAAWEGIFWISMFLAIRAQARPSKAEQCGPHSHELQGNNA